jgi:hypothetical protein
MGLHTRWYNDDHTIIHVKFDPRWSWDDVAHVDDITDDMMESSPHPKICLLVDMSATRLVPKSTATGRIREILDFGHPKTGILVVVGVQMFVRLMLETLLRAVRGDRNRLFFAESIEEAEELIGNYLKEYA